VACKAAVRNQEEALKVLLDWGVPVSAKDKAPGGQLLLHCAAGAGAVDCVRLLVKRRADVNATDGLVKTAMHLALKGSHMQVMKELLRAGATVSLGQKELPAGAHNVIKEVQLEKQMQEIKGFPTSEKGLADKLVEADKQVWKSMNAHMQLLERQEEIKMAKIVQDFDEKMRVAQADALEASKIEASLTQELKDLKVLVQTEQMKQNQVVAEIQSMQHDEGQKKAAEEDIAKDVADKQAELDKLLSDLRAEQEALKKAEAERDVYVAECEKMNEDIEAGKLDHKELANELSESRKELAGLRKDRKRIAELQAEAANLHDTVDDASNAD
jgi:myosin heavy subunit